MSEFEDRLMFQRAMTDYRVSSALPILIMIDGRAFSKLVKKKFKLPFDSDFMRIMDTVAADCCKEIQGCKFAYVQSDEISFFVDSRPTKDNIPSLYFEGRLCKMQSIIASIASGIFNREVLLKDLKSRAYDFTKSDDKDTLYSVKDVFEFIKEKKLAQFDCKVWNVPEDFEVINWFLLRQTDCIKNSKNQSAQTYLPHKHLLGLRADEQIELLKNEKGISWNDDYNNGEKYGRFIWKENVELTSQDGNDYTRSKWLSHQAWPLQTPEGREKLRTLLGLN